MKSSYSSINKELGETWKEKQCVYCGRTPKETTLNLEGVIHHNSKPHCLDLKDCRRHRKKK